MTEPELSADALLGGRVRLRQPRSGYRVAIDPILLAAAVAPAPGERVLDAGAGTAAAALCLAERCPGVSVVGLERDPELVRIGRINLAENPAGARVELHAGDLLASREPGTLFDQVMTNPPYLQRGRGTAPSTATAAAAGVADVPLADWLVACLARLRPRGRLTVIHRGDALAALLAALVGRVGDLQVFPLWPTADAACARRVIVAGRKAARGPCRLLRGMVLHGPDGGFTAAAQAVLRDAAALRLEPSLARVVGMADAELA